MLTHEGPERVIILQMRTKTHWLSEKPFKYLISTYILKQKRSIIQLQYFFRYITPDARPLQSHIWCERYHSTTVNV